MAYPPYEGGSLHDEATAWVLGHNRGPGWRSVEVGAGRGGRGETISGGREILVYRGISGA
jgi:hypothetical protein